MKNPKHSKKQDEVTSALLTELPFEERIWFFWGKYSRHIMLLIVLIILGFLGYEGISLYKESQVKQLQEEYRVAVAEGHEIAFAEANLKEPLAGTVFLAKADQFIDNANYDDALSNYKKALISLKLNPIADRARLGVAFATQMKGDSTSSKKLFSELLDDSKAVGAIRAEAAYQLALIHLQEKEYAKSKELLETIQRIPDAGIWVQKASLLRDSTPHLSPKA